MALNTATAGSPSSHEAPARGAILINAGGGNQALTTTSRGIYCGGAGNLEAVFIDGTTVTLIGLVAGVVYPFCVKQINQAGTTITNSHALL